MENEIYVLKKDRLTLKELKNTLDNKLNIYKGWLHNFPIDLNLEEKLLKTDLRLVIGELGSEILAIEYRLRDIDFELKCY